MSDKLEQTHAKLLEVIEKYNALNKSRYKNVIGISCESKNIQDALKIASHAKSKGNIVVMGGLHVSLVKGRILENSCVDYAIYVA